MIGLVQGVTGVDPQLTISGNKTTKKVDPVVSSLTFGCE